MSESEAGGTPNTPSESAGNDGGNTNNTQTPTIGNNNNRRNPNSNHRNNNNRSNNTHALDHQKDWKGDTESIGVILGLKSEKLSNKTTVDGLLEKLEGYAKKEFDFYDDVLPLIVDEKDPEPILNAEKQNLCTEDQKKAIQNGDLFEQMILKDKITRFGNRQAELTKNIGKSFELIWGQCTTSVKTMIKGHDEYQEKKKKIMCYG